MTFPLGIQALGVDDVEPRITSAWRAIAFGAPGGACLFIHLGQRVGFHQRSQDSLLAVAGCRLEQSGRVEQVEPAIVDQLIEARPIAHRDGGVLGVNPGEAAVAVQGDEVGDAAQDLALFGVAIAHPGQPLAEQLATGVAGRAGGPAQQLALAGQLTRQRHEGEAIRHPAGLGAFRAEGRSHLAETLEQVFRRLEQAFHEGRP